MITKQTQHDNAIKYHFSDYLAKYIPRAIALLMSPKMSLPQKRGLLNILINFAPLALAKRKRFRTKHGFAPDAYVVSVTNNCNLYCKYCFAKSGPGNSHDIDLNKLEIIIEELKREFSIRFITVTGGEPFPKVIELARRRKDITFNCYTNGTLLTAEVCEEIKLLGNIICSLSIVGNKEIHDTVRGAGNYDRIMEAVELLKSYSLIWGFSITESKYNYKMLTQNRFLDHIASFKPYFIRLIPYTPTGRSSDLDFLLSNEELDQIGNEITKFNSKYDIMTHDYINDPSMGITCMAGGIKSFLITENIQISPCVFIDEFIQLKIDNINNKSNIISILKEHTYFKNARILAHKYPRCMILQDPNWRMALKSDIGISCGPK
jgi:MoaA/NifB/PqqE/SkfB family radical SAM enzyme